MGKLIAQILVPFREFSRSQKMYFLLYGFVFSLRPLMVCLLLFWGYGIHLNMLEVFPRASLAMVAGHLPFTFLGLGARELVICETFSKITTKRDSSLYRIDDDIDCSCYSYGIGIPMGTLVLEKAEPNSNQSRPI